MWRQTKEARAAYRAKNRDKINAQKRAWRVANLEKVKEGERRADAKRRDSASRKEWRRQWEAANPELVKSYRKRFRERHALKLYEKQKAYYSANPDKLKARNDRNSERVKGPYREAARASRRKYRKAHPDVMLRHQATQAVAEMLNVPYRLVPACMAEAKEAQLKVVRVIKEARKR